MVMLQGQLSQFPTWSSIRFVSISVEPETDTPEVLRAYAEDVGADVTHWAFLTGSRADIYSLCDEGLSLPVREDALTSQRPITHSPLLVLVDRDGRVRGQYDLSPQGEQNLIEDLAYIMPEMPKSLVAELEVSPEVQNLVVPAENLDLDWLEGRQTDQERQTAAMTAFHDFRFTEQCGASGITFGTKS